MRNSDDDETETNESWAVSPRPRKPAGYEEGFDVPSRLPYARVQKDEDDEDNQFSS